MATLRVTTGRHIGYTNSGYPLIVEPEHDYCFPSSKTFPMPRHVGYGNSGKPLLAVPLRTCCHRPTPETKVAESCYPGGIANEIELFVESEIHCYDTLTQPRNFILTWNGSTGWTGSLSLPNGTLNVEFRCNPAVTDPNDVNKWEVHLSGCYTSMPGVPELPQAILCLQPLKFLYTISPGIGCCECSFSTSLSFTIRANCEDMVRARHVGYTNTGKPIVANMVPCPDPTGIEVPCCVADIKDRLYATVIAPGCCTASVAIDWTRGYFGCDDRGGAWVYDGQICGQNFLLEFYCNPGTNSFSVNMTGCINALLGGTHDCDDEGEPFYFEGTTSAATGTCCLGGGTGDITVVITEEP